MGKAVAPHTSNTHRHSVSQTRHVPAQLDSMPVFRTKPLVFELSLTHRGVIPVPEQQTSWLTICTAASTGAMMGQIFFLPKSFSTRSKVCATHTRQIQVGCSNCSSRSTRRLTDGPSMTTPTRSSGLSLVTCFAQSLWRALMFAVHTRWEQWAIQKRKKEIPTETKMPHKGCVVCVDRPELQVCSRSGCTPCQAIHQVRRYRGSGCTAG